MAELNIGDKLRNRYNKDYIGTLSRIETTTRYFVTRPNGKETLMHEIELDAAELAPKLSPDEAWLAVPMIVITQIKPYVYVGSDLTNNGPTFPPAIYESERRKIRHECYKVLGGAGIKVTEEVKARVGGVVEEVARAMGVRVI